MAIQLSHEERVLLNQLIHSDDPKWWRVVPDMFTRNNALNNLLGLGLIEVDTSRGVRVTQLGILSNEKSRRYGRI